MVSHELSERIFYSCVLAGTVLPSVVLGGWLFALYTIAISTIALLEWLNLCERGNLPLWPGIVTIVLFAVSIFKLRNLGYIYLVQLFSVVWLTDIGAYFTGKALGGPKLLEDISPNKTITGFLGGTCSGMVCGALFNTPWQYALIVSLLSQIGDFLESYVKRLSKVKDSNLVGLNIPGHGGILDRIDGLLLSSPVYYVIQLTNLKLI